MKTTQEVTLYILCPPLQPHLFLLHHVLPLPLPLPVLSPLSNSLPSATPQDSWSLILGKVFSKLVMGIFHLLQPTIRHVI